MVVLSDSAAALFEHLPTTYGTDRDDVDPFVARWLEALAFEVERLRALLQALRTTATPATADDSAGQLSRWEAALRIPVAPADATVAQRRARLLAAFLGRRVATGISWTDSMTRAVGSPNWTVDEHTPGANQLTITLPFEAGSDNAERVKAHARRITPANQELIFHYAGSFIVGLSAVGDEL